MPKLNFENASSIMQQFLQLYLQDRYSRERMNLSNELLSDRMREQQDIDTAQSFLPDIRAGKMMPGALPASVVNRLGGEAAVTSMMPSQASMEGPAREQIRTAKTQTEIPDIETLIAERAAQGPITELGPLTGTLQARNSRLEQIGNDQAFQDDRSAANSLNTTYNAALGSGKAETELFPAKSARELAQKEQEGLIGNTLRLNLERQLNPIFASRAGAEASARQRAEWLDPKVVAAKLDFEHKKRIAELAQVGARAEAALVANKNAAIKGLLPTYTQYRNLAIEVANSWAGSGSALPAAANNALSKLPVIGEALATGLEAAHAVPVELLGDPELSKKVTELNRLTDTLAQGMANAVLGNRGQTTENDRRTAKNILASSFTDAKSLEDLLEITDKMFTLAPTVAGEILSQDPFAEPAQILEEVARRARVASPAPGDVQIPPSAQTILSR